MWSSFSYICTALLILLILLYFVKSVLSNDKSEIFSPLSIISLVYIYYCVIPFFTGGNDSYHVGPETNINLFHGAALLSYICILLGFYFSGVKTSYKKRNSCFNEENSIRYAVVFFSIAFVSYASFRGIHFSIFADNAPEELVHDNMEHYFLELIYLYEAAFSLMIIHNIRHQGIKWYYLLMLYVFIIFIFAGTRARIVVLLVAALTTFYLYPKPKRVNYPIVIVLAIVVYLGFSVMDQARQYSRGLNRDSLNSLSYNDIKGGADENAAVYWFSAVVMDWVDEDSEYVYFEPLINALLSPIPRSIFPWKPDGRYLMRSQFKIIGDATHGAIFLFFTEGFISFGWLGVILYGFILGWLSKRFWSNYKNNNTSIGAILSLALYNGFCYNVISRGYLATAVINYVYIICLPFWIVMLVRRTKEFFRIK